MKFIFRFLVTAGVLAGGLTACNAIGIGGPTHRLNLLVEHYAAECPGAQACLLVKEPGQVSFDFRPGGIEGFTYEWGYIYEVNVDETAEGSSIRTVFRDQVSRTGFPPAPLSISS